MCEGTCFSTYLTPLLFSFPWAENTLWNETRSLAIFTDLCYELQPVTLAGHESSWTWDQALSLLATMASLKALTFSGLGFFFYKVSLGLSVTMSLWSVNDVFRFHWPQSLVRCAPRWWFLVGFFLRSSFCALPSSLLTPACHREGESQTWLETEFYSLQHGVMSEPH